MPARRRLFKEDSSNPEKRNMTEEALLLELRSINDRVTELCAALKERCPDHTERLMHLEAAIDGPSTNGNTPGLKARMLVMERTLGILMEEYTKTAALMRKMLWAVVCGPTGVVALFGAVMYFVIGK